MPDPLLLPSRLYGRPRNLTGSAAGAGWMISDPERISRAPGASARGLYRRWGLAPRPEGATWTESKGGAGGCQKHGGGRGAWRRGQQSPRRRARGADPHAPGARGPQKDGGRRRSASRTTGGLLGFADDPTAKGVGRLADSHLRDPLPIRTRQWTTSFPRTKDSRKGGGACQREESGRTANPKRPIHGSSIPPRIETAPLNTASRSAPSPASMS